MDPLQRFSTGIKELDSILDGGIPEYSVSILAGEPGAGKTILAQQMAFTAASEQKKVLYITTLSEPPLKLIRYQSQFSFFDESQVSKTVFFRDVAGAFKEKGIEAGKQEILKLVKEIGPRYIFIDSFKAIEDLTSGSAEFRKFCYDLSVELSSWEASVFLIGEYYHADFHLRPEFAIADCIFFLTKPTDRISGSYFEVTKMRGSGFSRGKHLYDIDKTGLSFYPAPQPNFEERELSGLNRISWGISGLDEMTNGGPFEGMATVIAGSAGVGKTILAMKFLENQQGVLFSFDNKSSKLSELAKGMGIKPPSVFYSSPVIFNPEKVVFLIKEAITKNKLKRIVLDSISDIKFPLPHLYDLLDFCGKKGVTTLMLKEIPKLFGSFQISKRGISVLADSIIFMRYVEIEGRIERAIAVLKMRGSEHVKEIRKFVIKPKEGILIDSGGEYHAMSGIMMGQVVHVEKDKQQMIRAELFRTLSPLGLHYFMEAANKGTDLKELFKEIDIFVHEGVLKEDAGENLKKRIVGIVESNGNGAR